MTEALKGKLRENKDTLKSFGAFLTTSDQLRETAKKAIMSFASASAFSRPEPKRQAENKPETGMAAGTFRQSWKGVCLAEST